jgi:hypothetical protein
VIAEYRIDIGVSDERPFFVKKTLTFQKSNHFPRDRFRKTGYILIRHARQIRSWVRRQKLRGHCQKRKLRVCKIPLITTSSWRGLIFRAGNGLREVIEAHAPRRL